MQIGRWNHQSTGGGRRSLGDHSDHSVSGPRRYGGQRSYNRSGPGPRSFGGRRPMHRRGQRGGGKRIGAFGHTEAEIAKFINRASRDASEQVVYEPEHHFADFALDERLKKNIAAKGYDVPTPIQDKAIPPGLEGKDVVGLAETGTGKTAAFLIPLIEKVLMNPHERVLVMAPTRELAVQIERELAGFAKGLGFRGMVAVGGVGIGPQISALRYRPSFVIGTPGRLKDLEERRALDFSTFGTVVLDEADRMLDMGFIDDMRFILGKLQNPRHTLFFSATMDGEIKKLIGDFLINPVMISVKTRDTSKNVDQDVVRIPHGGNRLEVLTRMLSEPEFNKVLVFGRTKHGVEKLTRFLSKSGVQSESIHGDKSHSARMRALDAFKTGKVSVLVATDVAARGLDIPNVSHVINYDLPSTYADYVHRIGRTGRASARGKALTFVSA